MSPELTTGVVALAGVVIGGSINVASTYWMQRRNEHAAARRSARLFVPCLHRCHLILAEASSNGDQWGAVFPALADNLEPWEQTSEILAGELSWDDWFTIYSAVREIEKRLLAANEIASEPVGRHSQTPELIAMVIEASACLTSVAISGARRRRLSRIYWKIRWSFSRDDYPGESSFRKDA